VSGLKYFLGKGSGIVRRRRVAVVLVGLLGIVMLPALAGAAPLTSANITSPQSFFRFCAEAQLDIANIDEAVILGKNISIGGAIFTDFTDFVYSKSGVRVSGNKAILTSTWYEYLDLAKTKELAVRCKMRTGESLTAGAWPPGSPNNSDRWVVDPFFGFGNTVGAGLSTNPLDQPCSAVNQRTINSVWSSLNAGQKDAAPFNPTGTATASAAANTLITTPDVTTSDGPTWTQQFPAVTLNGAVLEVPSKGLVVNSGINVNPRFEGAHYCTFVAPTYLKAVLLGQEVVS